MYKYPIALTQQFRFCGNPFRVDLYQGCSFGCAYCFSQNRSNSDRVKFDIADFSIVENYFHKAFETDGSNGDVTVELLRHRVPLHVGGMSDPFQHREFELHLTYKLIELSNKYDYPIMFSSKVAHLPDDYFEILKPDLHAFQTSLIGLDESFTKKFEFNTPSPMERVNFMKTLHEKGFWTCVRLQPLIDIEQALKVCRELDGIADFAIVEHLKVPVINQHLRKLFIDELNTGNYVTSHNMKNYELRKDLKIENINKVKDVMKHTIVGVGDNDLHYMSQSRNCCGLDTVPSPKFQNWLKYNLTYFTTQPACDTENMDELYIPKGNISSCLNPSTRLKGISDYKTYTDYYCYNHLDFMCEECPMYKKYEKTDMSNLDGKTPNRIRLW